MQPYIQNESMLDENQKLKSKIKQLEEFIASQDKENASIITLLNKNILETQQVRKELYELFPGPIIEINLKGQITYVNNAVKELYDISQNNIKNGIHASELIFYMEKPRFNFFIEQFIENPQQNISSEYITISSTGKEIPVIIRHQLIKKNNKATGVRMLLIDISAQKKLEREHKHINSIFEEIRNITSSGIFTVNTKKVITSWNKKAEEITGYKASEIIGKKCTLFDSKNCKEKCGIEHGYDDKTPVFKECYITTKSGLRKVVYKNTAFLRDSNGNITGSVESFDDVTHQRQVINELISAKQKAEESDNLKSAFLANMSHEIRTPINSILGFVELLKDVSISYAEKSQFLDIIKKSGKQLLSLIDDIINISKIEANQITIKREDFPINMLLDELFILIKKELQVRDKHVKLILKKGVDFNSLEINSDPTRVRQLLTNLLINAVKFTESGTIEFGYTIKDNNIEFYVRDTGKGIEKSKQQMIFNRFEQAEDNINTTNGTGLGLAISKGLVELLQGKIWVESELDKGSTFSFSLPYVPGRNTSIKQVKKQDVMKNYNWKGKTLLLVEDDNINFKYLELMLRRTEIDVIRAKDGKMAIDICQERDDIDIILMDIQMPNIDGYEATRTIRTFRSDVPIVAQTANAMSNDQEKCFEAGCNAYISKPIERDILFSTIEKELKLVGSNTSI